MISMPSVRTLAVMLAGILFGLCVLFFNLWRGEVSDYASYRAEVRAAGEVQANATEQAIEDQKKITEDTTNGWNAALNHLHAYYAGRERLRKSPGSGPVSPLSAAACRVNDPGEDTIPAAGNLAEACAETTVTLNYLQDWVERQAEAAK